MEVNFKYLQQCRGCQSEDLKDVVDFGQSAIADDYFKEQDNTATYPLIAALCSNCGLLQLRHVVDPSAIYDDYIYNTSSSPGLDTHFSHYADSVAIVLALDSQSHILDVGCNDGMLLKHFKRKGCSVYGVEPSKPTAQGLNDDGIKTVNGYWNAETSQILSSIQPHFDLITSNNVFANVDDIRSFASTTISVLKSNGVWVIETGYHYSLIENFVFDNIYHEHLSYFSVRALRQFFKQYDMDVFHVEKVESKGGSIRVYAGFSKYGRPISDNVNQFIELEEKIGLFDTSLYQQYMSRIDQLRQHIHSQLATLKNDGVKLIGFGASATTTTVMHVMQLGNVFDYLVDDNPIKHDTFSPGYRVKVKPSSVLDNETNFCVVILPWRFADMFIAKNSKRISGRGSFLKIMPEVALIEPD